MTGVLLSLLQSSAILLFHRISFNAVTVYIYSVVVVAFDEKLIVYDACRFRERFTITGEFTASVPVYSLYVMLATVGSLCLYLFAACS